MEIKMKNNPHEKNMDHSIWFKLIGDGGETCSREFAMQKIQMI